MEPLQERKSKKAPFNSSEDILDYILSSTLYSISDGLIAINQSIDYEEELSDSIIDNNISLKNRITVGNNYIQTLPSFKTLKNYGLFIAKKNNVENINQYNLKVQIIQVEMPKFADRKKLFDKKSFKRKLVFETDKISL